MSSLEEKTVRPGSFVSYAYYHAAPKEVSQAPPKQHHYKQWLVILVLCLISAAAAILTSHSGQSAAPPAANGHNHATVATVTPCSANHINQLIKVSISARHLWACTQSKQVYDSPVVTGIETHADTMTPTGTYQIYDKQTNTTLSGSDSTGSWNDPVYYWMPFLNNQYGTYGFHDATWRPNSAFGNIDPNSTQASHGCVELSLASAQWLYGWAQVGTTVSIQN